MSEDFVIRIGDRVAHDFSKNIGVVLAWRKDPKGYDYKVRFFIPEQMTYKEDWFKREVLVPTPTKEQANE